jgi:hypothetical protein
MSERVQQVFEIIDKVTAPMARIAEKVEHVAERMTELTAAFLGFEGIMSFREKIGELNETYRTIGLMRSVLGTTADEGSGLVQVFEKMGVGASETLNILRRMQQRQDMVEEGSKRIAGLYHKMGIKTADSPEQKLIKMAEYAQKTGINLNQVREVTGLTGQRATDLMKVLQRGPEALRKQFEEVGGEATHVNAVMLANFGQMQVAKREATEAIKGAVNQVYTTLMPAMTTIFERIQHSIDRWLPAVKRFADYLSAHMDKVLRAAELFGKYMMLSHAVGKLGGGVSVVGLAGKALEGGFGKEGLSSVGGLLGPIFKIFARFPGPMMAVALAVGVILKNWDTFKPILMSIYANFSKLVGQIWSFLKPLIDFLEVLGSAVLRTALSALNFALQQIVAAVNDIIWVVRLLGNVMADILENPTHLFHLQRTFQEQAAIMQAEETAAALASVQAAFVRGFAQEQARQALALADKIAADAAKKGGLTQDFRGSKFDITQNFDKDFDPDRIVAVMANEFGRIGERALQSGLAPLYVVR